MVLWDKEGIEKGNEAESNFQGWLDKNNAYFLFIKQNVKTFAKRFEKESLKRPDFIIFLPELGYLMVDAKHRGFIRTNALPVDVNEFEKLLRFNRKFNVPVWYAFSNRTVNYKEWFWIPVRKVLELIRKLNINQEKSPISKQYYYPIPLKEFTKIEYSDSLNKIFSKSF
jgi:hypothetical protein